jgi:hypothetical protein
VFVLANMCGLTEPVSSSVDVSKLVSWSVWRIMFNRGRYEASRCQQRFVKLRCTRGVGERTLDAKK